MRQNAEHIELYLLLAMIENVLELGIPIEHLLVKALRNCGAVLHENRRGGLDKLTLRRCEWTGVWEVLGTLWNGHA